MKNFLKIFLVVVVAASILFPNAYASAALQHIPVVNSAGPQHSLFNGAQHSHSGASVTDVDGDLTGYSWQFLSCPGGLGACPALSQASSSISGGSSVSVPGPTYTPNAIGGYTLLLTATDSLGQTNALGWGDSKSGMVTYNSGGNNIDMANAITIDSSNNIYVVGLQSTNNRDWAIRKYTSSGQLATTWGSNGMVTYNSGITYSTDQAFAVTIDSSKNIYVAGNIQGAPYGFVWAIRKYTSTGQLATTWGANGMVTYNSGSSAATAITIDSSNNIYVAGYQGTNGIDWAIRKYTSSGQLAATWGANGMVTYNSGGSNIDWPTAITIDSSNNIYVAGYQSTSGTVWAVRKYTSTGQLDTTWGSNGMVTYDSGGNNDLPNSITIDSSRNIYVAGQIAYSDWAIRKYTSTGQLAATWGSNGMVTYDSGGYDLASAITIDSSNNIYVAGYKPTSDWAIRKYTSTGQLDTTWGSNGMVTYDSGGYDLASAITIDSSNNIYVAGYKSIGSNTDWAVRKYLANGVLDNDPLLADIIEQTATGAYGNITVQAKLDGQPWPTSGNSAVTYALSGPSGNISNSSIPFTYQNVTADENYTLTYLSGGPAGAIINPINPIAPVSSQFLPSGASISFNLNFVSGSNLCPLTPQPGRTIISFEPYEVIGSPDYADHIAGPYSFSPSLPIETYDVTLVSYDSHTGPGGSGGQNQPNEKYYLKLLGQSNNLIASTNPTSDIPNDQDFVTTLVNTNMQIASKIYKAEAWHEAYIDNSDYNSLYPICAAFDESFDYSLSNSGASVVTKTDNNVFAQNTITKTLTAGNSQDVSLTVSGAPPGVTTSISGQNCNLTCESVITFTVSPDTIIGTYPITVTGSPLNKSTEFNLVIAGDPLIVSCLASPTLVFLGDTVTLTANVSGGTPPYIYSWNGDEIPTGPSPDINPFTISYNTVGQKSASVTVTDSSSPPFQTTCPTITVRASIDPQYKEF